jgi:hypothetical protein
LVPDRELFGLPPIRLDEAAEVGRDVQDKLRLWMALRDWKQITDEWMSTRFQSIDPAKTLALGPSGICTRKPF